MYRRFTEAKSNTRGQSIGSVLSPGFALTQIRSVNDKAVRFRKNTRISICSRRTTDKQCALRNQFAKPFDLMARESFGKEDRGRMPEGFEIGEFHETFI